MEINLNNPIELTKESLRKLIASEDDSTDTQFRVTDKGILFLSRAVGTSQLEGIAFRLETNVEGNGYVGEEASKDDNWVDRVYTVLKANWPNPSFSYCDDF